MKGEAGNAFAQFNFLDSEGKGKIPIEVCREALQLQNISCTDDDLNKYAAGFVFFSHSFLIFQDVQKSM